MSKKDQEKANNCENSNIHQSKLKNRSDIENSNHEEKKNNINGEYRRGF